MVRGATPDVVLTGGRGAGARLAGHRGGRRGGRRRRRRHHRRPLRRRGRPRGRPHRGRARPRGGGDHPGDPHRRGRPRDALVGGHAPSAAAGLDELADDAPSARHADPGDLLPADAAEVDVDEAIARAAVGPGAAPPRRPQPGRGQPRGPGGRAHRQGPARGRPAGRVGRRAAQRAPGVVARGCWPAAPATDVDGGWQLPRAPRVVVDTDYVLAAIGLLADEHAGRGVRPARWPCGVSRSESCGALACARAPRALGPQRRAATTPRPGARSTTPGSVSSALAHRLAEQRAVMRTRAEPVVVGGGSSNFSRAQVPWGLDLAAAWSWRFLVIVAAGLVVLKALAMFAVVILPVIVALLIAALSARWSAGMRSLGLPAGLAALWSCIGGMRDGRAAADLREPAGRQRRHRPGRPGRQGPRRGARTG